MKFKPGGWIKANVYISARYFANNWFHFTSILLNLYAVL
jgi:hypothetical protein